MVDLWKVSLKMALKELMVSPILGHRSFAPSGSQQRNTLKGQATEARSKLWLHLNMRENFTRRKRESRGSNVIKTQVKRDWDFKSSELDTNFFLSLLNIKWAIVLKKVLSY